jgi:hypothetical protein
MARTLKGGKMKAIEYRYDLLRAIGIGECNRCGYNGKQLFLIRDNSIRKDLKICLKCWNEIKFEQQEENNE